MPDESMSIPFQPLRVASAAAQRASWNALGPPPRRRRGTEGLGVVTGPYGERHRGGAGATDLRWHERQVDTIASGQLRISVPVDGPPFDGDANAVLTKLLDRMWVSEPVPGDAVAAPVVSVVAAFTRWPLAGDDRQTLLLMIAVGALEPGRRIDGVGMGRQLRGAVAELRRLLDDGGLGGAAAWDA